MEDKSIRIFLGCKLREYRKKNNLTIYEVGAKIGKNGTTVSSWETGRTQPDADTLLTLCDLYGIASIAELYGRIEPINNTSKLSDNELHIISNLRKLNDAGKIKVSNYIADLIGNEQYQSDSVAKNDEKIS